MLALQQGSTPCVAPPSVVLETKGIECVLVPVVASLQRDEKTYILIAWTEDHDVYYQAFIHVPGTRYVEQIQNDSEYTVVYQELCDLRPE